MALQVVALLAVVVAEDCSDEATCTSAQFLQLHREVKDGPHPWPHARGPTQAGTTPESWTTHSLSWSYSDPAGQFHNIFSGGPVIDAQKHIYQNTNRGLFAFNSSGHQLWHYETPGVANNEVTLYGDLVLGSAYSTGSAFAVNRSTGTSVWITKLAEALGEDVGYPQAADGVFVVGGQKGLPNGGNALVFGLETSTGNKLWQYAVDVPVWNLTPLFPGDGTTVFMDMAGGIYKLNLHTGEEVWKTLIQDSRSSITDGGAAIGPNRMVYTCSNPRSNDGAEGTTGIVRAFHLSNGTEVWSTETDFPCNTFPAVGTVGNTLSVVVAPGSFMGTVHLRAEILSLDAFTGAVKWSLKVKPYDGPLGMAAGDVEGFLPRAVSGVQPICLPAHWSGVMIDGNGMVLVGRSDGKVYSVFGPAAGYQGVRSPNMTVSEEGILFQAIPLGSAFLHGALAAAPNMFVISSCDTLYVFQK